MISPERFNEKFKDKAELYGWRINDKRISAIYNKIYANYESSDFDQALDSISEDRFSFENFEKQLNFYRSLRFDQEETQRRLDRESEIRKWFNEHRGMRFECVNDGKCGVCERTYCDVVAKDSLIGILDIMDKKKTACEVHVGLNNKYRGIKFDKFLRENCSEYEPF